MNNGALTIEQALQAQGYLLRPVEGDSMMPLLDQRTDLVKLVAPPNELKPYDLPLYRRPNGALVLHRVVKVKADHYIICGDNRQIYERVPREWIVALAVGRYRGEQYLAFDDRELVENIEMLCRSRDRFGHRCGVAVRRAFPSWSQMKQQYPILRRVPLLLPLCHAARWGRVIARKFKSKRS